MLGKFVYAKGVDRFQWSTLLFTALFDSILQTFIVFSFSFFKLDCFRFQHIKIEQES